MEDVSGLVRCTVMRIAIVMIGVLSASKAAGDPTPAKDATAWCKLHPGDKLPIGHIVTWRGKLDGDRRQDLIVNLGSCGSTECHYAAFVRCSDGTYSEVFSGYAARVRRRGGSSWARLQVEHVGDRAPAGSRPRSWFDVPFTADGYRER